MANIYDDGSINYSTADGKLPVPPYKHIFLSIPILATIVTAMCQSFGFYTLLSMTPTYLNNIQHFSLDSVSWSNKFSKYINYLNNSLSK